MAKSDVPPRPEAADEPREETRERASAGKTSERPGEPGRTRGEEADYDLRTILPELLRRGLSAGRGRVGETILPRELTTTLISHMGEIRGGIVKAVGQEVGRFLREADIASEIRKVMSGLDVEAKVRLRFSEREDGALKPEIDVDLPKRPSERPKREER
jgi:hypothetical protein